jgi:hypothetical protein
MIAQTRILPDFNAIRSVAEEIGSDLAHEVLERDLYVSWPGLNQANSEPLAALGLKPTDPEWFEAERLAARMFTAGLLILDIQAELDRLGWSRTTGNPDGLAVVPLSHGKVQVLGLQGQATQDAKILLSRLKAVTIGVPYSITFITGI